MTDANQLTQSPLGGETRVAGTPDQQDAATLEARADAAWSVGNLDECTTLRELAYKQFEADGDARSSARSAITLYDYYCFKGRRAVANGWLQRAKRGLEGHSDAPELALQLKARILISLGKPADGFSLFDEAMLLANEGRLSTFVLGKVYCSLISVCDQLGDLQRAAEWTEVGSNWADGQPSAFYPGLCRVHRAELLRLRGDWVSAEAE